MQNILFTILVQHFKKENTKKEQRVTNAFMICLLNITKALHENIDLLQTQNM